MPDADANLMTLFAEALERTDPAARATFLDGACEGNAALRRRVEALLAAHDGAGPCLELEPTGGPEPTSPETLDATWESDAETRMPSQPITGEHRPDEPTAVFAGTPSGERPGGFVAGQVIAGRYTLLEVLGEGGMGTVYRADQTEPVKRQVALKLIKVGMDSRAVLARFDAERQALALMDHPNIARVYDGGSTATGQPFFVMELVSGEPVTAYCDRQRLSVRARLELFVAVCQAVQHAHQKGIIHRDLKPGNVLVTEVDGRPTPKVIDFGVAKATEFKLTDQSLADTGAIVGTPTYMSPEQADPSSMDIDTRTDIYALGVILYELLSGSPPLDVKQFKRGALLEMLRMVREVDPPRPSTKVSTAEALPSIAAVRGIEPAQLKRALRGDLDWIVMKALEKDRTRRYETANGFAADVLRHLSSEPVQAAPPSRAYRMRKFVRKHRGAVIAASLVVLALVGGIAGTTWGLIRADRARSAEAARVKERDEALIKEAERLKERDAALKVADARADELKYRLGVSDLVLASVTYDNRDVVQAAERLDKVPANQRGWEWRYLKRLTRGGLFTLYGHTSPVISASFSPDGSRIVTASQDQTAKVWDARTGTSLLELKGPRSGLSSASFSPDGTRILAGTGDNTAKVWDAQTGTPLLDLKGHTSPVDHAAFSPDGSRIVTASTDKTAKVWDARTGISLLELKGHTDRLTSAAFSPDGSRIVTASTDKTAKVWDARTGTRRLELRGHTDGLTSAAFSPDGTRILTGSLDDTAKVWDAATGSPLLDLKRHTFGVSSAAFSPDGSRILTASGDKTAKVWDVRTGTAMLELKGHTSWVTSAAFSPDGTRIVSGSGDDTAKVWDAATGSPLLDLKGHAFGVYGAAFSPDGSRIVTGGGESNEPGEAKVWDARTGIPLLDMKGHTGWVYSVSYSPDGTRIATGSLDRTAKVWDARTGRLLLDLKGHTAEVMSASFSPEGTRIVTGSLDRTAKVWDARTGSHLFDLNGHTDGLSSASFSPDGSRIATGSWDKTAKVWDARTGSPLLEIKGFILGVASASFSPDGTQIVTGSADKTAKVWDARTGSPLLDLNGHTGRVWSVSFSPDGSRIVTGGDDQTAKVWDVRTGTPLLDLKGHKGRVSGVAFSPDGSRIVTASADKTAKVWEAGTVTPWVELKGHAGDVDTAAFSPDGSRIVTGSVDQTAKVWDVRTGTPLLDLRDHTHRVYSAAFSPDGSRIVTSSLDGTAKIWDAGAGTPLLELVVRPRRIRRVSFSPDGMRIVIGTFDETTSVWDARTGQELKGEPIPSTSPPRKISPDGRLIAHPVGNRVELIPLQPDGQELAYRRLLMQPNFRLYREAYDTARAAHDAFAAQFYLELLPLPERTLLQAASAAERGRLDEAIARYREAIALDSNNAGVHISLGLALGAKDQQDEAIACYRKAIALDPKDAYKLGSDLFGKGQLAEAEAVFREAIRLDPGNAFYHDWLAYLRLSAGDPSGALPFAETAVKLDGKSAQAQWSLGRACAGVGDLVRALATYRKALELDPKHVGARSGLAQAQRLAAVQDKLPALLNGDFKPMIDDERLALSELCSIKKLYRTSAGLYADAFAADPRLADKLKAAHRYNAACYAALAAAGQGEDAVKLDDKERSRLRKQALDWLRADLGLWTKELDSGQLAARTSVQQQLKHWQHDSDLAGLRDKAALAKLPAEEREACQKLWADVAALLKAAWEKAK